MWIAARSQGIGKPETDHAPASEEETAQLTTYDPAGDIPFSNWDGEEGTRP